MDLYIVLGLERGATVGEIKRAYKRLARRYHPDINPGDRLAAAQFRRIAEAYEALSDPERRRVYDQTGAVDDGVDPAAYGFEGFDFSISVDGADASTFGDLFGDVFGQRDARPEPHGTSRGADLHQSLTIAFEDAVRGGPYQVTVTRQAQCVACRGAGWLDADETDCASCQGAGSIRSVRGHMVFARPCAACGGSGRHRRRHCPACHGQQIQMRTETLLVNVPAGLSDGARIRVAGKGNGGRDGGEAGDLYIGVRVEPHPIFHREGDDVHVSVPIAVHEAALGARIEVPAVDGAARLRIPPGTQSGQRLRVRGRGVRSPRAAEPGDLVVEVRVVLPRVLDERSKELLREFGRINAEDVRQGGKP